jgi:hypothetical protein
LKIEVEELEADALLPEVAGSVLAVRVKYGSLNGSNSHTAPYVDFGVVPYSYLARSGWLWLRVGPHRIPFGFARYARAAFTRFEENFGWELAAHIEKSDWRAMRFARYLGFQTLDEDDSFFYMRRV